MTSIENRQGITPDYCKSTIVLGHDSTGCDIAISAYTPTAGIIVAASKAARNQAAVSFISELACLPDARAIIMEPQNSGLLFPTIDRFDKLGHGSNYHEALARTNKEVMERLHFLRACRDLGYEMGVHPHIWIYVRDPLALLEGDDLVNPEEGSKTSLLCQIAAYCRWTNMSLVVECSPEEEAALPSCLVKTLSDFRVTLKDMPEEKTRLASWDPAVMSLREYVDRTAASRSPRKGVDLNATFQVQDALLEGTVPAISDKEFLLTCWDTRKYKKSAPFIMGLGKAENIHAKFAEWRDENVTIA